jgi:hypothetical protein
MFSFLKNRKYRADVLVQIHAILIMVPELSALLKTMPALDRLFDDLKGAQKSPLEAAVYASMLVLERLLNEVPLEKRADALRELSAPRDEGLRYFARVGQEVKKGDTSGWPKGAPFLALAIGHAIWYLDFREREGELSRQARKLFLADVGGMLQGKPPEERATIRGRVAVHEILGSEDESD